MALGFLGRFFFFTLNVAGEIITISMGISSAQLFNPAVGGQTTATTQFFVGLATLFFLAIQGHHLFLSALYQSFELVPIYKSEISLLTFKNFAEVVQDVSVMGLKMASPVMIAILIVNIVMALVGRAVPQINVLITSLPVNILVGFVVMIVAMPLFLYQMNSFLELSATKMFQILREF
jgi:flagellar biosynthetic protein FliR